MKTRFLLTSAFVLVMSTLSYAESIKVKAQYIRTSLSISDFDSLLPLFTKECEHFITYFTLDGLPRVYPYEAKNAEQLPTPEPKLFFILFYKKINCIQPALAAKR